MEICESNCFCCSSYQMAYSTIGLISRTSMKQWWMHRGMHEANFTLATVQEEGVKRSSLLYMLHTYMPRGTAFGFLYLVFYLFYLPLVVHYCRPLTCENKTHHSLWEFRRCPLTPCSSLFCLSPSNYLSQLGKGGKRQCFYHAFPLLHNLFAESFSS